MKFTDTDRAIMTEAAVKDLDKRYRWDLLWSAARTRSMVREILSDYTDAHIDTVLRTIVNPL